ncbi:hypothetical protein Chor_010497 [Crotalus horridus]
MEQSSEFPESSLLPVEGSCTTFPNASERCGEPKHRFFYNVTSKSCEPFVYHGCPRNRNRYHTLEECKRYCGQIALVGLPEWHFPEPMAGFCFAEKPGYCPPSPRGALVPCLAECFHDGSCKETKKCCSYGCSLRCMEPVTGETQSQPLCGRGGGMGREQLRGCVLAGHARHL